MPKKRLTVTLKPTHAMTVTRVSLGDKKLVYVILAQRKLKYLWGRSRIAYIGTTKNGMPRFAQSAAAKAEAVLGRHGVTEMEVRIITCAARQRVKTWVKLERALLLGFREKYGKVPLCNKSGKKMKRTDEHEYFAPERIKSILDRLDEN
ncbi:MAG: hypothetical protein ABIK83_08320 [Candidatus Zixiibacteriota bacterium]